MTNGLIRHYDLDEFTDTFFQFLYNFFYEIPLSKQNSPRWDAAVRGVTSWVILFANVKKEHKAHTSTKLTESTLVYMMLMLF